GPDPAGGPGPFVRGGRPRDGRVPGDGQGERLPSVEEASKRGDEIMTKVQMERAVERAARRFTETAWDRRELDVAYAEVDSPFGPLLVAVTRRGLVRVAYPNERPDDVLEQLSERLSPR